MKHGPIILEPCLCLCNYGQPVCAKQNAYIINEILKYCCLCVIWVSKNKYTCVYAKYASTRVKC